MALDLSAYDIPIVASPLITPDEIHAIIGKSYAEINAQMPAGAYAWLKSERPDVFDTIRIEEERLDAAAADLDTEAVRTHAARCGKYWCRAWYLYDQANPMVTA